LLNYDGRFQILLNIVGVEGSLLSEFERNIQSLYVCTFRSRGEKWA
jgi:hypothetical protein